MNVPFTPICRRCLKKLEPDAFWMRSPDGYKMHKHCKARVPMIVGYKSGAEVFIGRLPDDRVEQAQMLDPLHEKGIRCDLKYLSTEQITAIITRMNKPIAPKENG